ncbi:hypothetical protein WJX73_002090 [Symbiochloris irregularis]|uniref:EF-hand domain-containing protein n=1 Tax=Symbiochloris irregularis TaxID=706552 RepID=A0AAW1NZU4_9CHLO
MPEAACKETWGVFPCSVSLPGSMVLMLVYGRLILYAANWLSDGSELLLEILNPGLIGGLVLPILGALPDAFIIAVSGLGGDQQEAQQQISIGIGTLAGSSILLISLTWAGCLWRGRCDLKKNGLMKDKVLTRTWKLAATGVSVDELTPLGAVLMGSSVFLYAFIQIPSILSRHYHSYASLAGAAACFIFLAAYCGFQVLYPEMQKRQIEAAKKKHKRMSAVRIMEGSHGKLMNDDGSLNMRNVEPLFREFDKDDSGAIDQVELRALLLGLSISHGRQANVDEDVRFWMKEFDRDQDNVIDLGDFCNVLHRWLSEQREGEKQRKASGRGTPDKHQLPDEEHQLVERDEEAQDEESEDGNQEGTSGDGKQDDSDSDSDEDDEKPPPTPGQIAAKAVFLLVAGTAGCAVISDPLVDAVSNFSTASGIPAFFVAFAVTPFAISAGELVSSLQFAKRKRSKNLSLTFSQIYGAVTLNNTLCLGVFLLIVHFKRLTWTYTSEVATLVGATLAVAGLGAATRSYRTWLAIPVALIYPLSIFVVWVLDYKLHLDE